LNSLGNEFTEGETASTALALGTTAEAASTTAAVVLSIVLLAVVLSVVLTIVLTIVLSVVLSIVLTVVLSVVLATVAAAAANSEPDAVILSTTLSNRHENGLMVAGGGHGASTVVAVGETSSQISSKKTLAISLAVDTLEESKLLGVGRVGVVDVATHILDSDMRVSNNLSALEILGSSVVGVVRVGEGTSYQVVGLDGEGNGLVRLNVVSVLGAGENSRDHVLDRRNFTHGNTVARTLLDLKTVGQGCACTEVDEVGLVGSRGCLTGFGIVSKSVDLTVLLDVVGVQAKVSAAATIVVATVLTVVLSIVLAVVLSVVLSVVLTIVLAIVLALTLATATLSTAKLSVGNTRYQEHGDEGREPHVESWK
jgi:hypothetical protein